MGAFANAAISIFFRDVYQIVAFLCHYYYGCGASCRFAPSNWIRWAYQVAYGAWATWFNLAGELINATLEYHQLPLYSKKDRSFLIPWYQWS